MIEQRSVLELIKEPIIEIPQGKLPVRMIACGIPYGVNSVIHNLHVVRFAEVAAWSPPLPSPVKGEIIRILTRYINISR
ncbi:hypothetical protein [Microseira sp. BLCC-F43]|jgi:hypothetical protein|uniref:hypothetical protein n=1 Tax=Microseira sp. BLCC-F43 TaxID=3153602 RepID=UPI0035B8D070